MIPRAVLMKTGLKAVNTARPVTTAHPKTIVYSAKTMQKAVNTARPNSAVVNDDEVPTNMTLMDFLDSKINKEVIFTLKFDLSNSGLEEFQQPDFEGYGPKTSKSVSEDISNEVRESPDAPLVKDLVPNSVVVNAVRGHPQKEDQGYVDSGCSRHMTGNMSYLSDFKEFDGGYVTFGGGAKEGKITGKGTLKTIVAGTNSNNLVDGSLFDSSLKNASNDETQPFSDAGKKDDEGVCKESGIADHEKSKNSTQGVNTTRPSINTKPNMFSLGDNAIATHADFFGDETEVDMSNITTTYPVPYTPNTRIHKDHSLDHVIVDVQSGVLTRRMIKTTNEQGFISVVYEGKTHKDLHTYLFACFLSQEEPKKVWTLVDLPLGKRAIGTKWVYKNKKDERVARIEAIKLFLAYASFKDFVVYQMDVKSAFRYDKIEEEVYACQPLWFEDPEFPDRVYKVEKALYGLHQALRAWYETLSTYFLDNGFQRGRIDKTLFIKRVKSDIILVQVYVDDIIFGSTKKNLCIEFKKLMHKKFQISSIGKLTFFLGPQVTQKDDGIFINQDKYVDEILKKFGFSTVKTASTPMETSKTLLKDAEAEDVDVHLYRSMIGNIAGPSITTTSANFKTSTLNINTVSPTVITTRSNRSQNEFDMFSLGRSATLEATHADLFGDETEIDMSNLTTFHIPVHYYSQIQ
ncbi:putative ribonuclease H-like domain-containing protein [Tanacetum coccineum]|uniref:Ribonuclease H-like domain-containing protein n=1 Tax=Tanacetum coccineum TaxID=301880 RepID=A0ABQ5GQN1_9ASTR